MPQWTTTTLDLRDGASASDVRDRLKDEIDLDVAVKRLRADTQHGEGLNIDFLAVRIDDRVANDIVEQLLSELTDAVSRAVSVKADNSTTNAGEAYLYVQRDGAWVEEDYVDEADFEPGDRMGTLAASEMHVEHGIPAVSSFKSTW